MTVFFLQILLSTFICSVSNLSSFKNAKGTCKITKKHILIYAFLWRRMKFCGYISEWELVSFVFLVFLTLTWNMDSQIEVVKIGGGLSQVHPPPFMAESIGSIYGLYIYVRTGERKKNKERTSSTLAIWALKDTMYPLPITHWMLLLISQQMKTLSLKEWLF